MRREKVRPWLEILFIAPQSEAERMKREVLSAGLYFRSQSVFSSSDVAEVVKSHFDAVVGRADWIGPEALRSMPRSGDPRRHPVVVVVGAALSSDVVMEYLQNGIDACVPLESLFQLGPVVRQAICQRVIGCPPK